jgi:hypothetical protein
LNNITYFNEDKDKINKSFIYKKEVLSPFSSINTGKNSNISHKKFNLNNNNYIRKEMANNIKNNNNSNRIRHNHTHTLTSINSKNIIYELNNNNGTNFERFNNNKINNYNLNNFLYFSNDKERNTLNNKSYGNLRMNTNKKDIEIFEDKNRIDIDNIFKLKK